MKSNKNSYKDVNILYGIEMSQSLPFDGNKFHKSG